MIAEIIKHTHGHSLYRTAFIDELKMKGIKVYAWTYDGPELKVLVEINNLKELEGYDFRIQRRSYSKD